MVKGLGKALNSLASHQVARTTSRLLAKEDCRMSERYSGCKHAPKEIWIEKAEVVDLIPSQLVLDSKEVVHDLFGDMYYEEGLEVISDITFIKNGVEYQIAIKD